MSNNKPLITSLDAFPGSGKTYYFRQVAMRMLDSHRPSHLIVYAAPTKALCQEVYDSLKAALTAVGQPFLAKNIHSVWMDQNTEAENTLSAMYSINRREIRPTKVSENLNVFLGTKTLQEAYPGIDPAISTWLKPLPKGSIILTTHESFNRVRDFPPHAPTWAFFDEARQCLDHTHKVYIPQILLYAFLWMFRPVWVNGVSAEDDSTVARLTRIPEKEEVDSFMERIRKVVDSDKSLSGVHDEAVSMDKRRNDMKRFWGFVSGLESSRVDLCLLLPSASKFFPPGVLDHSKFSPPPKNFLEETRPTDWKNSHSIKVFLFHRPTGLFKNYDRVTVLSAFFKDSQMYHSLVDSHSIVSLINQNDDHLHYFQNNEWVRQAWKDCKSVRARDSLLQDKTFERLRIVPLMTNPLNYKVDDALESEIIEVPEETSTAELEKYISRERLSKYFLDSGLIVSHAALVKVRFIIDEKYGLPFDSGKVIREVFYYWYVCIRDSTIHRQKPCTPVFRETYAKKWSEKYNADFRALSELYTILKPFMFDAASGSIMFPAWRLTRIAASYAKAFKAKSPPLLIYNSMSGEPLSYLSPSARFPGYWPSPLVSNTNEFLRGRFQKKFEIPEITRLNGLNTWMDNDHLVHLAALNPTPDMVTLFEKVLPNYSVASDFLLENLIQTLYRTSLRDPSVPNSRLVYLYISHPNVAIQLAIKVKHHLNVCNRKGLDLNNSWTQLDFRSKIKEKARYEKTSKTMTRHSAPDRKRIKTLRVSLHYYKKLETASPLNQKQVKKRQLLQKELNQLLLNATGL